MKTFKCLLTFILNAGLAIADSCTTSTVSLQPTATAGASVPTDGADQISLEITGCSDISGFGGLNSVARVNLYKNSFTEVNLAGLRITDQIRIADNPNLEKIVLPDPRPGQTVSLPPTGTDAPQWTDVEIVDNPQLNTDNIEYQGSFKFWDWGARDLSSFVLSGGDFHSDFFYPVSTPDRQYPEDGHVYTTTRFVLNSTDFTFDCSYLNSRRYQGAFKGDYTCQGRTVVPSSAQGFPSSRTTLLSAIAAAICYVALV